MRVWKAIRGNWENFKNRIGFKIRSRNKVKFWKDK